MNVEKKEKEKLVQCYFCNFVWIKKVKFPISCPRCKRRFDYIKRGKNGQAYQF